MIHHCKIVAPPPNVTAIIQPMDEGIRMTDANISGSTEQRAEEQNGKGDNVEERN